MAIARMFTVLLIALFTGLIVAPAYASSRNTSNAQAFGCAQLLSPSEVAGVYLRLVEHYIKHVGEKDSIRLLNSLIAAKTPINPFDGMTNSISVQLGDAIRPFYKKITSQEWAEIREAAKTLLKEGKNQQKDRSAKKEELKMLFAPKLVATSKFKEGGVGGAEWQAVDDSIYISIPNKNNITLYRFKDEKIEEIDEITLKHTVSSKPKWQIVDDRVLLTFNVHNIVKSKFPLFIYELKKDKLKQIAQIKNSARQSDWRIIGDRVYLVTFADKMLKLHELTQNELNEVQSIDFNGVSSAWRWQTAGGKTYLSVTNFVEHFFKDVVYVFDEKNKQLVQLAEAGDKLIIGAEARSLHQLVGERTISPYGVLQPVYWKQFEFLELKNDALVKHEVRLADGRSSFEGKGSVITVSIGSTSYILELDDDGLRMTDFIDNGRTASDRILKYNKEHFVARLEEDGKLHFYEIRNGMFQHRVQMVVDNTIQQVSLRWVHTGEQLFLLYHGENEFGVIKIFNAPSAR